MSYFSSVNHLLCLCAKFLILFHLTKIRFSQSTLQLMHLSFGDFTTVHHKDWHTYSVSIDFPSYSQWDPCFITLLKTILILIGAIVIIIREMLHGRISSNTVFLLLLVNFVSGFRLGLMYISLIENIRSSLIHLQGFQLLVLLP